MLIFLFIFGSCSARFCRQCWFKAILKSIFRSEYWKVTVFEKFENVFVISLESRKDRRRDTERELSRIGVANAKFFSAIQPQSPEKFGSIGEHGCFMSHLEVLKICRDFKDVLILEDDVCFSHNFLEKQKIIRSLPPDWDIFYGGHGQLPNRHIHPQGNGLVEVDGATEFVGAHCYAVNGQTIPKLIMAYRKFLTRERGHADGGPMPLDGAMNIARRQLNLRTFISVPPLANQRSSRTDIGKTKWFDNTPLIRNLAQSARDFKNMIK
jgi:glycosyl transferase, family 25